MTPVTTKPLFFFLALATWGVVMFGGVALLATGYPMFGGLVAFASIPVAALVAIAGERPAAEATEPAEEQAPGTAALHLP